MKNLEQALQNNNLALKGIVEESKYVYDKDVPHLSYDIEVLEVNDRIDTLVVLNRLDSKSNPRLVLSLKNSTIQGCKQTPITFDNQYMGKASMMTE